MRFEVHVDDGDNLNTLHAARQKYNADNAKVPGFVPAEDMPSYVQRLIDQAVVQAVQPLGPTTLSAAKSRIAELEERLASTSVATPAATITP